jgi:hypothetical protein
MLYGVEMTGEKLMRNIESILKRFPNPLIVEVEMEDMITFRYGNKIIQFHPDEQIDIHSVEDLSDGKEEIEGKKETKDDRSGRVENGSPGSPGGEHNPEGGGETIEVNPGGGSSEVGARTEEESQNTTSTTQKTKSQQ